MPQVVRPSGTRPKLYGWSMPDPCSVVSLLVASVIIFCAHKALQPPSDPLARGLQTTPRPLSELPNSGAQVITEPAFETVTIGK